MKPNLKSMSIAELYELRNEVAAEIDSRSKEEREKLLREFHDKAKALGVTLEELMSGLLGKARGSAKPAAKKVAAKYVHPGNSKLTWTGRGKRPRWIADWLESGKSLDDLKV